MSMFVTGLRRALWLALIATVGGAVWAWWRNRDSPILTAPAEWPPLAPDPSAPVLAASSSSADDPADAVIPPATTATTLTTTGADSSGSADTDRDTTSEAAQRWVPPHDDGSCPVAHPIKANDNSHIFHVPGGRFHERTKAERCYASADDAIADGYRQAKS